MPTLTVNGARLHYEVTGAGHETIVFAHGLLFTGDMFAAQVAALSSRYRCITYDLRGQGRSEVTRDGYDLDTLTEDAAALIEALGAAPCHFCGLSMGGFIGLRLAIRRAELLRSLTLLDTSADAEAPETVRRYRMLNVVARWLGVGLVVGKVLPIMFGQKFLGDPSRGPERDAFVARIRAASRVGISRATRGVIAREGVAHLLERITTPTLVVVGEQDVATPPSKAERIHAGIAGSRLVVIPGAGHSSCIEAPAPVNAALREFLGA